MVHYNGSKKEFLEQLREQKILICYGCGNLWREAVRSLNLYSKLSLMIDNYVKKADIIFPDDSIRRFSCVFSDVVAREIKLDDEKQYILLVTSIYWKQIIEDLQHNSVFDKVEIYIWPLMKITETSYESMYEDRLINPVKEYYKKLLDFQGVSESKQREQIKNKEIFMREKDDYGKYKHLVLPKIVFFLTTRCTLRCKECTALIPQFISQFDIDVNTVLSDMKKILEAIDEVIFVQLAGGESLLYPNLEKVLDFLLQNEKVFGVTFVTNATIIPNENMLKLLANPKVYITISDYGVLENLYNIVSLFEKRKISFELLPNLIWQKVGDTEFRDKKRHQLKFEYLRCGNGLGCKMVENGYLHICDRSARMFMQNKFESTHDYVSISCEVEERRDRIRDIYLADYADACNHCDYANVDAEIIEPAEQIGKQLQRSAYTIVKRQSFNG